MPEPLILPADRARSIERAVALLRAGGIVGLPTDTVYGLGAHASIATAIERLYEIKGRERQKAIPVLLARTEDVTSVVSAVPEVARRLAERFWPGPVTLVLPKAPTLLDVLTGGADSVAVRVPAHAVTRRLILALGAPLATTSANLSGQREATTAQEVRQALQDRVPLILDGGRCPGGVASTVIDCTTIPPRLLRRGALAAEVAAFLALA